MFGKSHTDIKSIARVLRVEIPTAEVYIIDAYCAVAPMISFEKLASELNINSLYIDTIAQLKKDMKSKVVLITIEDNYQ